MESYEAQLRRHLRGQLAPECEGGRLVLWRCPTCDRIWLQQGPRRPLLHLSMEEQQTWAQQLHADLDHLPLMSCRSCATRHAGGQLFCDEYVDHRQQIWAYGYVWEGAFPQALHLLLHVQKVSSTSRPLWSTGPEPAHIVTDLRLCREVLNWATTTASPIYQPLPPAYLKLLAQSNVPGAHAPGTEGWSWHGAGWRAFCPPFGALSQIVLAQALPSGERFTVTGALAAWRTVVQRAREAGSLGNEPDEGADT